MRQPGDLLLVSCYELGHPPLAVATPMAFLERVGFAPAALDISVEPFDEDAARRARFCSISVPMHTALRLGVRVAERVRQVNPACHICFYGLYAVLNADYLLERLADSVIGGEYEEALAALVRYLEAGGSGDVRGVARRGRPAAPVLERLRFPVPSRAALPPLGKYAHIDRNGTREPAGYVEASRGCLHLCLHCPIPPVYRGRFFVIPREIVLEDARRQVRAGATHITFGDPDFLNGPAHSLEIVRALHRESPDVTFDFTAKVEHILERRALFPELSALGCAFMVSAVESLSGTVLGHLEKGHTRPDVFEALKIVRDAGIAFRPTWVPFTPWTTREDYIEMLDFIEDEGLIDHVDPVQYGIRLLVPPGSLLLDRAAIRPFVGPLDESSFTYPWTHPDPRMDHLQKRAGTLVQEAAKAQEDGGVTFFRVRALAHEVLRGRAPAASPGLARDRPRPPRLTEPWFC